MFESLSQRLETVFHKLRGRGRLSVEDVNDALREVRLALLEADVHFRVVKAFVDNVRTRAVGSDVLESLTPGQSVIKIVHDELVRMLGEEARLAVAPQPPTIVMLVGLQGSGKTTFAAKLARHLAKGGKHPLLVADDLRRPAAVEQLRILAGQVGVPFSGGGTEPVAVARVGLAEARRLGCDTVIVDTAGRQVVDDDLMQELRILRESIRPHSILLVVDAMTGQTALEVAQVFSEQVGIDGVVLTKMDGDARGGAALSLRSVTGKPILFLGTGERPDAVEAFHPERVASRILGMGDVLTLIERAQSEVSETQVRDMEKRLRQGDVTLDDFLEQMRAVRRMGPLDEILAMIPGMRGKVPKVDEREVKHIEAIVCSMTAHERRDPKVIDASRKRRIARGSGTSIQEVNRLLKQFEEMRKMLKGMKGMRMPKGMPPFGKPLRGGD